MARSGILDAGRPPRHRNWNAKSTRSSQIVAAAQRPDGYLDSYFELERADERWTDINLHEMYCAGHLFQAAVAHYRATGKRSLLDVAIGFADHIDATFGPPELGKRIWHGRSS